MSLVCATCSPQKGRKSSSKDWKWQKLSGKWFWRRCRSSLTWKRIKLFFLFINITQNSSDQLDLAQRRITATSTDTKTKRTTQTTPPTRRTTTSSTHFLRGIFWRYTNTESFWVINNENSNNNNNNKNDYNPNYKDSKNNKNYTSGGTSWLDKCTVSFLVVVFDRDHKHNG